MRRIDLAALSNVMEAKTPICRSKNPNKILFQAVKICKANYPGKIPVFTTDWSPIHGYFITKYKNLKK